MIYTFYKVFTGTSLSKKDIKTRWTICFFTLVLTIQFILSNLRQGQVDILVLAIAVLALKFCERKQDAAGGIALALSAVIKVLCAPLIAWFFFRQKFKVIFGVIAGTIVGLLLPALIVGFGRNWQYIQYWFENTVLHDDLRTHTVQLVNNASLQAVMYRFLVIRSLSNTVVRNMSSQFMPFQTPYFDDRKAHDRRLIWHSLALSDPIPKER